MKVLFLNSSGQMGGAETSLSALMEGLRVMHPTWSLALLLGEEGPLATSAARLGVAVEILSFPQRLAALGGRVPHDAGWTRKFLAALISTLRYRDSLKARIRQLHPDIIHTNGMKMHVLVASLSRRTCGGNPVRICHVHDYVSSRFMAGRLLRAGSRRYDAIVANSNSVAADLLKARIPSKKLISIYNGVRVERFCPVGETLDIDQLCGLSKACSRVVRVGLVATFAKWKGHITFLRALALLPRDLNIRAYVIGGPIYQPSGSQYTMDELRVSAKEYYPGGEVGFTGVVASTEAAYRSLDVVVHASTEPEPFGMVIIEAMACQKAVIVSRGGGAAEIFEDEATALAHDPGDAAMLAKQIERLVVDPALRLRLGASARAAVAVRFQAEAMAGRFADLYGKLLTARQSGRHAKSGGRVECYV